MPGKLFTFLIALSLATWGVLGCKGGLTVNHPDDDFADDDTAMPDDDAADDDAADDDAADDDATDACDEVALDFESGDEGFDHDSLDSGYGDSWDLGTPSGRECHSGDNCWATNLSGDYDDCESSELVSPEYDISGCSGDVEVVFWHLYQLEDIGYSRYDGAAIQLSGDGGDTWLDVFPSATYSGAIAGNYDGCGGEAEINGHQGWSDDVVNGDWQEVTVSVDEALHTGEFRIRFLFGTDQGETDEGWFIDDIEIADH